MTDISVMDASRQRRRTRGPRHNFYVNSRPWQIVPTCIAPVLPGETMKSALMQMRGVSDPIHNPLIGWWMEHYLFYVKHRDLDERDHFVQMMVDPDYSLSSVTSAVDLPRTYFFPNGNQEIDWLKKSMDVIVRQYFRDEGEDETDHVLAAGEYIAALQGNTWLESHIADATYVADDIDFSDVGSAGGANVTAEEVLTGLRQYQLMRQHGMVTMSYEEYLMTYGVRQQTTEIFIPELLRYTRDWQYPSNTIDPTSGVPRSAVSWTLQERADKDRYFKEPGFIVGITVCRPKAYLDGQKSHASTLLKDAYAWLPAMLSDDPATSMRRLSAGDTPLNGSAAAYAVDAKDLFIYGDQLVLPGASFDGVEIAVPTSAGEAHYPALTDMQGLFVDATTKQFVYQDGVWSFQIASRLEDTTPTTGYRTQV